MLEAVGVDCFYGVVQALRSFSLSVEPGEILCLLGRNGAGKTTALKTIMGLAPARGGKILFEGTDLTRLPPHEIPRLGVGYVPQGRRLFAELTVVENLRIGFMTGRASAKAFDRALALFPLLKERLHQRAGTLSGGEQQMLAMARAIAIEPKMLLLDEPTEGLMPSMVARIRQAALDLKHDGVTMILVEQRVDAVLPVADRVAFVENGSVSSVLPVAEIAANRALIDRYVGVGA